MTAGETGVEHYVFEGVEKIAGFAPVGVNGWSIGVTQDTAECLAASHAIRNSSLGVTLAASLLVFRFKAQCERRTQRKGFFDN